MSGWIVGFPQKIYSVRTTTINMYLVLLPLFIIILTDITLHLGRYIDSGELIWLQLVLWVFLDDHPLPPHLAITVPCLKRIRQSRICIIIFNLPVNATTMITENKTRKMTRKGRDWVQGILTSGEMWACFLTIFLPTSTSTALIVT